MSSPNPRKRPAPGVSPNIPMPIPQMPQQFSQTQPDQVFRWNGGADGSGYVDAPSSNVTPYTMMSSQPQYGQTIPAPSTALARRQVNRALVPSARPPFDATPESWNQFAEDPSTFVQPQNGVVDEHDNLERLEEQAQRAKKDATNKRKQIPPFVQKLSSFLDESRNTELIRWSDKGDSFVVLDEDEFAKTLIPELFKHNNYASFVRQLNMYGFHKRVGLSDNSMKASERKNKSPSEYYNPYFRRGHPNLLWLINKPKGGNKKKNENNRNVKQEEGDNDSDDEIVEETYTAPAFTAAPVGRAPPIANDIGPLPRKDLVQVKTQLERVQQQQNAIHSMLSKLRQEHTSLFQQAIMFQTMHERHENSINAILNFLANVFRKSLEEQGGTHSVQDLLASIIPNSQGHGPNQMPQGSVVDLGEFLNQQAQNVTTLSTPKRQQRLLPPIPQHPVGKASTLSPASTPSPAPQSTYQGPQMGSVTELFDTSPSDSTSPGYIKNELQNNPHEGMMKIINDTNAGNTSGLDLGNIATKTPVSMSNDQRNKMLSIMAGQSSHPSPSMSSRPTPNPAQSIPAPSAGPSLPNPGASITPLSSIPPPSLQDLQFTQSEIENLQRLTDQNASHINHLSSILGPLSPSGRIPGLDDHVNANPGYFDDSSDFDQFINTSALSDQSAFEPGFGGGMGLGMAGNGDGNDFNFSLDGPHDYLQGLSSSTSNGNGLLTGDGAYDSGRVYDMNSPVNSPSPAATEEITRNEADSPERDSKRRRKR
ncbi:hypothetical protein B0T22DRAFT_385339 [Podospora appendiculata]|uniref:HSF-type DNA-binding domain-containing protein n=1 Tax=Podospora appendiculata TaxID=314037 RepID=A0AAE0X2Z9_9PEZI|nr:hypothetical protein B0T22DRAFT_385339 [Podospora appendiculata]